jgi:hypothetical protein
MEEVYQIIINNFPITKLIDLIETYSDPDDPVDDNVKIFIMELITFNMLDDINCLDKDYGYKINRFQDFTMCKTHTTNKKHNGVAIYRIPCTIYRTSNNNIQINPNKKSYYCHSCIINIITLVKTFRKIEGEKLYKNMESIYVLLKQSNIIDLIDSDIFRLICYYLIHSRFK